MNLEVYRRRSAKLTRWLIASRSSTPSASPSLVYGIEPYVVLKDIWGAKDREVEALSRWVLDAFVETALRQAAATPRRRGKS